MIVWIEPDNNIDNNLKVKLKFAIQGEENNKQNFLELGLMKGNNHISIFHYRHIYNTTAFGF